MNAIKPSFEIFAMKDPQKILEHIERAGRTAYKSEGKIKPDSAERFIKMLISKGHESVLEHEMISVRFICDRGISHELVRHRIASFTQESTRYVNYSKNEEGITVIEPCFLKKNSLEYDLWVQAMNKAEGTYLRLVANGLKPEQARCVLPHSLKTEVIVSANLREWRHIFNARTDINAHEQMRELMVPLLVEFKKRLPEIFGDIGGEQ